MPFPRPTSQTPARAQSLARLAALALAAFCAFAAPALAQHAAPAVHAAATNSATVIENPGLPNPGAAAMVEAATTDHAGESKGHGGETNAAKVHDAEQAHGANDHHGGEEAEVPALPSIFSPFLALSDAEGGTLKHSAIGHFIEAFEKHFFLICVTALVGYFVLYRFGQRRSMMPDRFQAAVEIVAENLLNLFTGILGEHNKKHVPFVGTLFLFIWVNNLSGIIPFIHPATGLYGTTLGLALMVFVYVNGFAIKDGGLWHFVHHLMGSPKDIVGWVLAPMLFVLEVIGTLAKPLSLSLRLFGNIMGEDILLGVFLMLGLMVSGAIAHTAHPIIGVPLHFPFLFMSLLTSTVQALVFSLLTSIYIALLLPPHDHHHDEHPEEHTDHIHDNEQAATDSIQAGAMIP